MPSLEPGKRFADRYALRERLGDGGHAEVWAAVDEQEHRRVALKFLHAQICDADEAWLFLSHEADMAQRLDHPGVLRTQAPQRDGHTVFLPMECAGGGDISALRGQSWEKLLPILRDVAQILEHAHSRGVVHRDIKPGNVLFDASGAVRLTDFGTASRTGSAAAPATGSPFSASPQQLRGEPATTADDVYGLGALAYELLSRHPPYYPDFDPLRVLHQMPALLRPAQPAPDVLIEFVMAMLAREPQDRPDLGHVMRVFGHLLAAAPQSAATPDRPARRVAMPRLWLGIAAIFFAAGCAVSLHWAQLFAAAPTAPDTRRLEQLLSQGVSALLAGRIDEAQMVYSNAALLQPSEPRVHDGQVRIDEIRRDQQNMRDLAMGITLERNERWSEAVTHYQYVLGRDKTLVFAQDGLVRSRRRAALDQELADYVARPERLTATAVRLAAERALARAEATSRPAPQLDAEMQQVKSLLGAPDAAAHASASDGRAATEPSGPVRTHMM